MLRNLYTLANFKMHCIWLFSAYTLAIRSQFGYDLFTEIDFSKKHFSKIDFSKVSFSKTHFVVLGDAHENGI